MATYKAHCLQTGIQVAITVRSAFGEMRKEKLVSDAVVCSGESSGTRAGLTFNR